MKRGSLILFEILKENKVISSHDIAGLRSKKKVG